MNPNNQLTREEEILRSVEKLINWEQSRFAEMNCDVWITRTDDRLELVFCTGFDWIIASVDRQKPIDVLINSAGGEINSGLLIYDAIQSSTAPIRTYCIGRAYSMAALLVASGRHGRYILPHGELMLHEPLLGNRICGNSSSMKSISDSLLEIRKKLNRILAFHTGRNEEEVEQATGYDHYFSPADSLDFGLCDEIVDFCKIMGEM